MPYINKEDRPRLDKFSAALCAGTQNSRDQFLAALWTLFEMVYGTPKAAKGTRYFMQNELIGVLNCARFEWQRRFNVAGERSELKCEIGCPSWTVSEEISSALSEIAGEIGEKGHEQRAGALNYFLTVTFLRMAGTKLFSREEVPGIFSELAERWYRQVTAPYEDGAIEKNGDCF